MSDFGFAVAWFFDTYGVLFIVGMLTTVPLALYLFVSWFSSNRLMKVWHLTDKTGGGVVQKSAVLSPTGDKVSYWMKEAQVGGLGKTRNKKLEAEVNGVPALSMRLGIRTSSFWIVFKNTVVDWRRAIDPNFVGLGPRSNVELVQDAARALIEAARLRMKDIILYLVMGGVGGAGFMAVGLAAGGLLK